MVSVTAKKTRLMVSATAGTFQFDDVSNLAV